MSAATETPTDLDSDRDLLRRAVAEAGAEALRHFRSAGPRWEKAPGQVVTEADLAIDDLLRAALLGARPGDGWLSEERPDDGSRHRRRRVWIVAPIYGTRAFADGAPEFAVSIALAVEGEAALNLDSDAGQRTCVCDIADDDSQVVLVDSGTPGHHADGKAEHHERKADHNQSDLPVHLSPSMSIRPNSRMLPCKHLSCVSLPT